MRFLFVNRVSGDHEGISHVGFRREGEDFAEYCVRDGKFVASRVQDTDDEDEFIALRERFTTTVIDANLDSEDEALKYMGTDGGGIPSKGSDE